MGSDEEEDAEEGDEIYDDTDTTPGGYLIWKWDFMVKWF